MGKKMGNSDKETSDKDFVMSNNYEDEKPLHDDENEAYEPYDEAYARPSSLPIILTFKETSFCFNFGI